MGIIFGTEGHMAEGTRPKAIPRITIAAMATIHELMGKAKMAWTTVSKMLPRRGAWRE